MAKYIHADVLDAALNHIKANCTMQVVCSAMPTTYAEATAAYMLAQVAMAPGDFGIAAGVTSGRRITVAGKTGASVINSGTATHVALVDATNSKVLLVTTIAPQSLTAGNPLTFGSYSDEIRDPV